MKRTILTALLFAFAATTVHAQEKFYTKTGKIFFKCTKSPLEKIEATNKSGTCVLDTKTGNLQFAIMMKGFEFERALMQEHFNENYIESDKYPKSDFKGVIVNSSDINFKKNGTYDAKAKGKLTIHGVTKDIEAEGKIVVSETKIALSSVINVSLPDYNIKNDKVNNISNNIKVTIDCLLEPFQ